MRRFCLLLLAVNCGHRLAGVTLERIPIGSSFYYYEENRGQAAEDVRLIYRSLVHPITVADNSMSFGSAFGGVANVRFAAANSRPAIRPVELWPGILNRFEGAPEKWLRAIPAYRRVQLTSVAPGVDLILGQTGGHPSFDFVIAPGSDPAGAFLEPGEKTFGQLYPLTGAWSITGLMVPQFFRKPRAWQQLTGGVARVVEVEFRSTATSGVGFLLGNYDSSRPLYIETHAADELSDQAEPGTELPVKFAAIQSIGDITYVSGSVPSAAVCATGPGNSLTRCTDALIAAFRPDGEPLFVSVLAGKLEDYALLVGATPDAVVIAGNTGSADFPVTAGAYQAKNAGPLLTRVRTAPFPMGDTFLARVHPQTGDLLTSTFFGGAEPDNPIQLVADAAGVAVLATTLGQTFPTTTGAWIRSSDSRSVLFRFDATLSQLLFSTYLPFSGAALAVHSDFTTYVGGLAGPGAATTPGAILPSSGRVSGLFLARLSADGSRPVFATFLGDETIFGATGPIAVAGNGDAFLFGTGLLRVRGDGAALLPAPNFPGPIRYLSDAAGGLLAAGDIPPPVQPTTPDALLMAGCSSPAGAYLKYWNADGTVRVATYLPILSSPISATPSGAITYLTQSTIYRLNLSTPTTLNAACMADAASLTDSGAVSPGEIVTLLGAKMGPQPGIVANPAAGERYPTMLGGVRVLIGGISAPLLYAQASQINAVVPFGIAPDQEVEVAVGYQGETSRLSRRSVSARFSAFTLNASGAGQAAALNQDGTVNSASNPATRGSIVVIYGTGSGISSPPSADGATTPFASPMTLPRPVGLVRVFLENVPVEVLYAGAAPGLIQGVTQINFRVPEVLPAGTGEKLVTVRIDQAGAGNAATISVR